MILRKYAKTLTSKTTKAIIAIALLVYLQLNPLIATTVYSASSPWTQSDWSGGSGQTAWATTNRFDSSSNVTTSVANQITLTATANWYNSSWSYRKKITFNNGSQAENLTNFPVLIKLTSSNFTFSRAKSAGEDIRFTDSDGTTSLSYQIEKWDLANSQAWIWVEVPQIDASSTTDNIYIYYGNSAATDAQDATGLWSNSYTSVWHLSQTGNGTLGEFVDSTANAISAQGGGGTASQVPTATASGYIGTGQYFTTDDYINIPAASESSFDFTDSSFTVSGWINSTGNTQHIISKNTNASSGGWIVDISSNKLRGTIKGTGGASTAVRSSTSNINDGAWHHFAITFTTSTSVGASNTISVYIDGALNQGSLTNDGSVYLPVSQTVEIGRRGGATAYLTGTLDEITVASTSRSQQWIASSYLSESNTFATYDSEVARVPSSGTLTSSIYDTEQQSDWGTLTFSATTPASTSASVKVRSSSSSSMTNAVPFDSCQAISSGSDISTSACVSDGDRYLQYQVTLTSSNASSTPTFSSFSAAYSATAATTPATYYVSSSSGSDSNPGTISQPFATLSKVNTLNLNQGDTVYLKRGDTWTDEYLELQVADQGSSTSPVTISAYGTGNDPIINRTSDTDNKAIVIYGDWFVVEEFTINNADYSGVEMLQTAENNIIRNCEIYNAGVAVRIKSSNNTVKNCNMHDLIMVTNTPSPTTDDYGAIAVSIEVVSGGTSPIYGTILESNTVTNAIADSYDYSRDGGFVEIFGSLTNTIIRYNKVYDSKGFIEIGAPVDTDLVKDTYLYYNVASKNTGRFLLVNGDAGGPYQVNLDNLTINNNTIYESVNTGSLFFFSGVTANAAELTFKNNILFGGSAFVGESMGSSTTHTYNTYARHSGSSVGHTLGTGEQTITQTQMESHVFTDVPNRDFRLRASSILLNDGTDVSLSQDLLGVSVPQGSAVDPGAYEYKTATTPATYTQLTSDLSTISEGGWTNGTTVNLKLELVPSNSSESATPSFEVISSSGNFTGTASHTGSTSLLATTNAFSTTAITSLSEGTYKWRYRVTNDVGSSSWTDFGSNGSTGADFGVDTTSPTGSILINSNEDNATSQQVTLTLSSSDAGSGPHQMMISNDSGFSGASWETYQTSKTHTLAGTTGTQTVYVKYKDTAGNESSTYSDYINVNLSGVASVVASVINYLDTINKPTVCTQTAPVGIPNIFYINRSGSKMTVYFTPVDQITEYYIQYGENKNNMLYGFRFASGPSSGAISANINSLKPSENYYIRVRAGNGCQPGNWSQIVMTRANSSNTKNIYSEAIPKNNLLPQIKPLPKIINIPKLPKVSPSSNPTAPTITITPKPTPTAQPTRKTFYMYMKEKFNELFKKR